MRSPSRWHRESRIVYTDNDPMVLAHARALLASTPEGACAYLDADLRDTGKVLRAASGLLDFGQPVAVMLIGILHLIPDADDPAGIVARLIGALPAGSWLAIAHPASDVASDKVAAMADRYNKRVTTTATLRTHAEIAAFFAGTEPAAARGGAVPPMEPGRARPRRRGRGRRLLRPWAQALGPRGIQFRTPGTPP